MSPSTETVDEHVRAAMICNSERLVRQSVPGPGPDQGV